MNKTIQQLKKQAEDYAGRYGVANNVYGQDLINVLDQKFAELIIGECTRKIEVIAESSNNPQPIYRVAVEVLEHFGVEE